MRVAVLSDTHGPRFWKACPAALAERLADVDLILHAGDVCTASVLDELKAFAPVYVALGNNDDADVAEWGAKEVVELTIEGVRIVVIHDSGPKERRSARLRKQFPDADLVVFGHSHIPMNEADETGFCIFNPGSPTDKRRQPNRTMGVLEINDGRVEAEIINLP